MTIDEKGNHSMIEVKLTFNNPSEVLDFFSAVAGKPAPVVSEQRENVAAVAAADAAARAEGKNIDGTERRETTEAPKGKPGRPKKEAAPAAKAAEPMAEPEGGWTKDHAKAAMEKVLNHFTANPEQVDGKPVPALDSLKKWCMANPSPVNPFVSVSKVAEAGRIGDFVAAANSLAGV